MARLPVADALKVGMWNVQCETTDGRAWQYKTLKFHTDDPRLHALVRKLREPGASIDPAHWRSIPCIGRFYNRKNQPV